MLAAQPNGSVPGGGTPAEPTRLVRIVLVDDHHILRQGLRSILEREKDMIVVGEASTVAEAIAVVDGTRPTVVLLDLKLSRGSDREGIELCGQLSARYPELGVLVLTTFLDGKLVVEAVNNGARGYVVKDVDTTELVRSIRAVANEDDAFDSRSAAAMVHSLRDTQRTTLTDRENGVLRLLARGLSNRDIGRELFIADTTVKFHVRNIMRKLNAASRAEAAYEARKAGLI
ncbi:MAG: MadR family response regulator transcription factor [Sciscionella sp.]